MNTTIPEEHSRTVLVLGQDALLALTRARVAVFGVGGVGGHLCEALARAGIGQIDLFDGDTVSLSNINRQVVALHSTLGRPKVDVMKERIADINPACTVTANYTYYKPDTAGDIDLSVYDYIADAIDDIPAKIELCVRAQAPGASTKIISAMGAGNKLYPEQFAIQDLSKTNTDPIARIMRRELGLRGIRHLTVVYSQEKPLPLRTACAGERTVPGSLSFVPGVMGLIMAGEIIRTLTSASSSQM